ncbi:MAG: hypothetical protein HY356_07955 [Gammaproteobacteria bacterium]|nr:hypothetical protein [Gammaproteobacteria bacterium]
MDLQKIGMKFFAEQGNTIDLVEFIPVFHRWIQNKVLDDILIDVADYSHVYAGPGILLIAHEGNYSIDETGNQRGVAYYNKHELAGALPERLFTVCRKTLLACQLLEKEKEMQGRIRFSGNAMQVYSNDRLIAPNSDETHSALQPVLNAFLEKLFSGAEYTLERNPDPKGRYQVMVKASDPVSIDTLLQRLGNQVLRTED